VVLAAAAAAAVLRIGFPGTCPAGRRHSAPCSRHSAPCSGCNPQQRPGRAPLRLRRRSRPAWRGPWVCANVEGTSSRADPTRRPE
jgi:hypothetical protein